jgi:hypothetical protein
VLGRQFGINQATISRIISGARWANAEAA